MHDGGAVGDTLRMRHPPPGQSDQQRSAEARRARATTDRVEAFSDGVIAVAITLLVLTLTVPDPAKGDLTHALLNNWPEYAAYLVSFATIGIVWVNHHAVFGLIERVDRWLLFLNLTLLLTITLVPYTTNLVARTLVAGSGTAVAAVVYNGTFVVMGAAFQGVFRYAVGRPGLRAAHVPEDAIRGATLRFALGAFVYPVAMVVAFFNAAAALALDGAVAAYYALMAVEAM